MTTSTADITGDMIRADRSRRKLSRTKYAELIGSTPTKVSNMERGRALSQAESDMLAPFVISGYDPTGATLPTLDVQPTPVTPEPDAPTPEPEPVNVQAPAPAPAPEEQQPVILISGEEVDDPDVVADTIVLPGSGLPASYAFQLPGYHVTNSELRTFKRCKRKWWLAYYRELRLKQQDVTGPRAIGTRIHLALAAYYSTRRDDPRAVLEFTIEEDTQLLQDRNDLETLETLEKDADLSRAMLEGYLEWLQESGIDEHLQILGDEVVVEQPFCTAEQIGGPQPIIIAGKMDVRVRRTLDGAHFFMDHKTVGDLTSPRKTLHLDEQMLHYHLLEYLELIAAGTDSLEYTQGGLYNMLRKVKRTGTAKPPFFDRVEVRHNTYELQSYWHRVFGEVKDIVALRLQLDAGADHRSVAYPNPTNNCSWDCDFFAVCPMFDDGSAADAMLEEHFESHDPHDHYKPYGDTSVGDDK